MSDVPADELREFEAASQEVVDVLLRCSGMEQWLVTRVTGSSWNVIASAGAAFALRRRSTAEFSETLCAQMIAGGSRVIASVPESSSSTVPLALRHGIGSYVGAVVRDGDGTVFGTLIGIDTRRHPPVVDGIDRQVALFASLLSARVADARRSLRFDTIVLADDHPPASIDAVTGLRVGEAWPAQRDRVERACTILGDDALVAVLHIDGLDALRRSGREHDADEMLREAAFALRSTVDAHGGRIDDTLVAIARNRTVDLSGLRRQLATINRAGVTTQLATSWRRVGDADGLAAAQRRALTRVLVDAPIAAR